MTFWSNRRVLVTGCSGLIGGYMAKTLLALKADVVGFDVTPVGTLPEHGIFAQFPITVGDMLLHTSELEKRLRTAEVVIHLAANSGVEASKRSGAGAFRANIVGTLNILELASKTGVPSVVVASSNHVYGAQEVRPTPETAQLNQLDTYSASKICADYLARAYAYNYGTPTAIVRNTNCYGPIDPHHDHIIPATIISLLNGESPVIKGTGETVKSYIHVQDTVNAYLAVAEWVYITGRAGEAFNVADPESKRSVAHLVQDIARAAHESDTDVDILGGENDQNDEDLAIEKIRNEIGWVPSYTLTRGLRETADYLASKRKVTA